MGFKAGKSSKNAPAVCMYLLEHSVVILLYDAYKDQVHFVSPFDEEAAAVLCLISNHHRRSPPPKKEHFVAASTCFQCQTLLKTQTEGKKTKHSKHTHKQNYTTSTKPKTHKSFASCSPAESNNFTTTKEEPTTPKLQQQKGLKTQEKSLETKRKYELQN